MTHEDAGHFAKKRHGVDELNQIIAEKIRETISDDTIISCAEAHGIANGLKVSPAEVGATIDLLEIKIKECQLGLFGHEKGKDIPSLPETINPEIESAIESSLVNGRHACSTAWGISKRFKLPRPAITAVYQSMKIKIFSCQFGAFG